MLTEKRKKYEREWAREKMVSLTGFRLKAGGMYQEWQDGTVLQYKLNISRDCFLTKDSATGFYRAWDWPNRLFVIPTNDLRSMQKKGVRKDAIDSLVAEGRCFYKKKN